MPLSEAGRGRARRIDQALDNNRVMVGNDRNRTQAAKLPPSHGDKSRNLPNTNPRRVGS